MDPRSVRQELAAQGCAQLGFALVGVGLGGPMALFALLVAGMMLVDEGDPTGLACCVLPGLALFGVGGLAGHAGILARQATGSPQVERALAAQVRLWAAAALLSGLCTLGLVLALAWNMAEGGP